MKMETEKINNFIAAKKDMAVIAEAPIMIATGSGTVVVFGHELVSKKEIMCLEHCLTLPELALENGGHNVKVVVFNDNNLPKNKAGKPVFANCSPDSGAIVINLLQTFTKCVEVMLDYEPETNICAIWHRNMLLNYLHEIHHLNMLEGGKQLTKSETAELEELAENWSTDKLYELAKKVDISPSHHAESPFMAQQIMELLAENKEDWAKAQRLMLENNIMYHLPETDKHSELILDFKGYIHLLSGDEVDDPTWNITMAFDVISEVQPPTPTNEAISDVLANVDPNTMVFDAWENEFAQEAIQEQAAAPPQQPQAPWEPQPGTVAATETGPVAKTLPETGLTQEQTGALVKGVYTKCYNHIFGKCQRLLHSDVGFQYPEAVSVIPIQLTEQEKQVVVKMDCLDQNGRWCPEVGTNDGLRGMITKNTKLPTYKLYVNNGGVESVRLLLPQNPGKQNAGQYTKTALQARGGTSIMYIMEANDAVAAVSGKFKMKIVDNVFVAC